ncbi:hypothetical protein [Hydrogenophaga sp. 2FB]|uniref:hypothetical protein n=1 Tax=Hydrogenophaga sp. 2FB TaxID=2502187 RepID=UPI0010F8AA1D|nr:hypothetical protein [Hydrogenophaga sp. 2FB]
MFTHPPRWPVPIIVAAMLCACASTPTTEAQSPTATPLRVTYSQASPSGYRLKSTPEEITIVSRSTTGKAVAAQVFLNVAMLALVGGIGVQPFSKDDLRGDRIEDVTHRDHLRNPIPTDFVTRLQEKVDAAIASNAALTNRVYENPLVVAGGSSSLVYHALTGTDEETYQLQTKLEVFKRREGPNFWTLSPNVVVDCSDVSAEPLPRTRWAQDDYQLVRQSLDETLDACEARVMARLPELLTEN